MTLWLLENALVSLLFFGIVVVVCRYARPRPAIRHALWLVLLVKLSFPPVVAWPWSIELETAGKETVQELREVTVQTAPEQGPLESVTLTPSGSEETPVTLNAREVATPPPPATTIAGTPPAQAAPLPTKPFPLGALLLTIWLLGAIGITALHLVRLRQLRASIRQSQKAPQWLENEVSRCAQRLGMNTPTIRILFSPHNTPFVHGMRRPRIYWPSNAESWPSFEVRRGLITHELAHLKRRDHWVGAIEWIATTVAWWNPLLYWVRARLRDAAEGACDAWVVSVWPEDRKRYARSLIDAVSPAPRSSLAIGLSSQNRRRAFEGRLTSILHEPGRAKVPRALAWAIAVLALGLLPAWSVSRTDQQQGRSDEASSSPPAVGARFVREATSMGDKTCAENFQITVDRVFSELGASEPGKNLSLGLIRGRDLLSFQSVGRDELGREPSLDSPFRPGSVSFTLTATLLYQLRDHGLLDLGKPLSELCEDAPPFASAHVASLTPMHLLDQTSGLPPRAPKGLSNAPDLASRLASLDLDKPPGVTTKPSSFARALLGTVIEEATDQPFADVLRDWLLLPMGMPETQVVSTQDPVSGLDTSAVHGLVTTPRDLLEFVSLQLLNAGDDRVHESSILELQRPRRIDNSWLRPQSLAWDHIWTEETDLYRLRTSVMDGHSTFVGFSSAHKVGIVLHGRGVGDLERPGTELIACAIRHFSVLAMAQRANAEGDVEAAAKFYGELCEDYPSHSAYHFRYATACLTLRRCDEAIDAYQRALELQPELSSARYNIACAYAVSDRPDDAFDWLEEAIAHGFRDDRLLATDCDLDSLRKDPRFKEIQVLDF